MTSLGDDVITDASLDDGGGESDDKVWGMPKYEHNHLGNLTDEEYLAAVSQIVYCTCFWIVPPTYIYHYYMCTKKAYM